MTKQVHIDSDEDPTLPHLRIYDDRSILYEKDGRRLQIFREGSQTEETQKRAEYIRKRFAEGFLDSVIKRCKEGKVDFERISDDHKEMLKKLVDAITSEVGRAIVGLAILQMATKAIEPKQSVRLHKSGRGSFSWAEGIPMRVFDSGFVTPFLRKENLLKVNKYGVMMTRSLAENYPYTKFYKAAIRGAKREWTELVDLLEANQIDAKTALDYSLCLLIKRSKQFQDLATEVVDLARKKSAAVKNLEQVLTLLIKHMANPGLPAARLLEVGMHSLMQVIKTLGGLGELELRTLSQMRQANKKAGNIADIELTQADAIAEAWDAKYGKPYLYDELLELHDKLSQEQFPELRIVGFVTETKPDLRDDVTNKMTELQEEFEVKIVILNLQEWVTLQASRFKTTEREKLAKLWLVAYAESLALRRPLMAPIDEPTETWLQALKELLSKTS